MFVTIFTNFSQFYRSDKVVYAKQNGGKFNFILEEKSHKAVPIDQVSATIVLMHLSRRLLRSKQQGPSSYQKWMPNTWSIPTFHQTFC